MKIRLLSALALGFALSLALGAAAYGQDAPPAPQQNQNPGPGSGAGWSQRGGRGSMGMGGMGMGMGMGRAVHGTVMSVAADHYTVKTFTGETYTIHFSVNTRMLKQSAGMRGDQRGQGGENGEGGGQGWGRGYGRGGNPPQPIKASDIKVGDAVAAVGDVDAGAKSVGATYVLLMDPERARQMQQMEADYGKTWLMGRVTAINGVSVTLTGALDNAPRTFVADENTTFRKRRDPIALTDIQVGDMVRAEGAVKDGAFTATTVNLMGDQNDARVPRSGHAPADNSPAPQ